MSTIAERAREMRWNEAHGIMGRAALMRLPEGGWRYGPLARSLSQTAEALRLPSRKGLRIRIATGFSLVVVLTLVIAGWSYYHISTLGSAAEDLYIANYRSIQYAQEMHQSLASMELLRANEANPTKDRDWLQNDSTFRSALGLEYHNFTEIGEPAIAEALSKSYGEYVTSITAPLGLEESVPRTNTLYHAVLYHIGELRGVNERAMSHDAQAVKDKANFARISSLAIIILLVSAAIYLAISVSRRSFREFIELDRAKSNFVATAAHELKNPLTSIKTSAGMMLDGIVGPVTPKQSQMLTNVRDEASRVLELVRELLDLARLEAGTMQLIKKWTSLETLCESAIVPVSMQAERSNVHIALNVQPNLPTVEVDPNKVAWAVTNLISNAIRYSPRDGTVTVSAEQTEAGLRIAVADQGKGIKPEDMPRIFDKFVQVEDSTMGGSIGSGLGLSIAREIVQAHKGRIWVESRAQESDPRHGSTFFILLPHRT